MFSKGRAVLLSLILFAQLEHSVQSKEYGTIKEALKHGHPSLKFRIRQEGAKQQGLQNGYATTLQSKVGYHSEQFANNSLFIEATNVSDFFGQSYNPAVDPLTKSNYAVITDPKGTGITSMNIFAQWLPYTDLVVGRQYISLDNERMIGTNTFRQYPTSFDSLTIKNDFFKDFEIFYSFINYINTYKNNIFNVDGRRKLSTHVFNVAWHDVVYGKLTAYAYMHNDLSINNNSQNTFGLRAESDDHFRQQCNFGYELEAAYQKTKNNNPMQYSVIYFSASANKEIIEICDTWLIIGKLGYELIGGHNGGLPGRTFKFPLGTAYGFNGLAEGYSTIPDRGLMDYYVNLDLEYLELLKASLGLHLFQFAKGTGQQLAGREVDVDISYKFTKNLNAQVRYAQLTACNNSTRSIRRISGQLSYKAF